MSFIWPAALLLVVLVPLGVLAYRAVDRRRRQGAAAFGGFGPGRTTIGRHRLLTRLPPLLFVTGFAIMAVALARPQGVVALPRQEGTVVLAFDVSGSMAATDLAPTRMEAAKAAARDFVAGQPPGVVIGVVAFSDAGIAVQQPSDDQATVIAAIDRLTPHRGTSLGQGILASLEAIAAAAAGPSVDYYSNRSGAPTPAPTPVPAGSYAPAVIVLLTDGENNEAPDPLGVAQTAADQGVRIDTVGIGSPGGTTLDLDGFKVHTQLDAATLRQIADITGGNYYGAADALGLHAVYDDIGSRLVMRSETIELTSLFAGASLAILLAGALCSLAWLGRLP